MKTLIIGDTHLMHQLILPLADNVIESHDINRIIMVGDYVDQWLMQNNYKLYLRELEFLKNWKDEKTNKGIEVINLIGNHDVPHITGEPVHYSLQHPLFFDIVGEKLLDIGLQVAYQLEDFVVSHAGYAIGYQVEDWHMEVLTKTKTLELAELDKQVGKSRGGKHTYGSPVWADFNQDLTHNFSPEVPKQIVGHTPQSTITFVNNSQIIGVDTFSLSKQWLPLSDGSMLMHDETGFTVIKNPTWKTMETWDKLVEHFKLE